MNLPNKLTTIRIILVFVLITIFIFPYERFNIEIIHLNFIKQDIIYFLGAMIFIVASITDFFDGYIARKYNLVTTYGKFMDPIADKLLVNSVFIILTYNQIIPIYITLIVILRDIFVDGLRLIAIQNNKVIAASRLGKIKTIAQMVALPVLLLNNFPFNVFTEINIGLILVNIAAIISLFSGLDYFIKTKDLVMVSK